MIRARLWLRCAAGHDPITPVLVKPAVLGWEAKYRRVDLTIERPFNGEELLRRMKGWITVEPLKVIEVVKDFGRLKVLDDRELVVEMEEPDTFTSLQKALGDAFGSEVDVELIEKSGYKYPN